MEGWEVLPLEPELGKLDYIIKVRGGKTSVRDEVTLREMVVEGGCI